jgi:predicted GNAT superfamily acetyltransferase
MKPLQQQMDLRNATPADFSSILTLNQESVHFLSPLDETRLLHLHKQSVYHRVVETGKGLAGFLLAFAQAADYDSPNYRWFAERYDRYLYIDRIVVASEAQGLGIGRQLYADLFAFAHAQGYPKVTCEFDLDPPNPASAAFHRKFGFIEVGQQMVANNKLVSLQSVQI